MYFLLCSRHPSWWCTAIFCWHFCWPQQCIGFRFHLSGPEYFPWMLLLTSNSTCLQMSLVISPICLPAFVPLSLSQPKILGFDSSLPSSCLQFYPFFLLSSFQTHPFLSLPLLDPQFILPFTQKSIDYLQYVRHCAGARNKKRNKLQCLSWRSWVRQDNTYLLNNRITGMPHVHRVPVALLKRNYN